MIIVINANKITKYNGFRLNNQFDKIGEVEKMKGFWH